jgi:hypothetical protein
MAVEQLDNLIAAEQTRVQEAHDNATRAGAEGR